MLCFAYFFWPHFVNGEAQLSAAAWRKGGNRVARHVFLVLFCQLLQITNNAFDTFHLYKFLAYINGFSLRPCTLVSGCFDKRTFFRYSRKNTSAHVTYSNRSPKSTRKR